MATTYDPEKKRAYYLANREQIKANRKRRYYSNHEESKAWHRRWNRDHPKTEDQKEAQRIRRKAHYQANRQDQLAKTKAYQKDHPEVLIRSAIACNHRRRAEKAKAHLSDLETIKQWMKEMRSRVFCRCHWCGTKVPGRRIHFDHVRPLSKQGDHSISNLCISCKDCNLSKKARLIADWIVSGQSFLPI